MQQTTSGLTALSLGLSPIGAQAKSPAVKDMIIVNALGGLSNQNLWVQAQGQPGQTGSAALLKRMRSIDARALKDTRASGLTALNVTLGYVSGPEEPYEYTLSDIAAWDSIIRARPTDLIKVLSAQDILAARQENRIGIIFGFQNGESIGNDTERVKVFANLGVRIIQLTYNDQNQIGAGSAVAENSGLTRFGHEVVAALNEARVLVDLSHSGEQTCLDALSASTAPVAMTHTGCRALTNLPRNKTDKELRLVAEGGGVVGIYFMPFLRADGQARADDVVQHLEHALDVCGQDHVGIGTDGDATAIDDMTSYRAAIAAEVRQRQQTGISAAGETSRVVPLVPDLMGPTQFQKLADMLHQRGHSTTTIEKILGLNFLRLIRDVWSG
ncbi:MAG: membrane dipeptidase [Gammaproteobacteria bacterium]|nr:membrane dipeptidase [Gammaproteobacteria bacterium]